MTGLLPDVLRDAIAGESTYAASESFALVTIVLLILLMVQRELLRARSVDDDPQRALSAFSVPLLAAVLMTIAARLAVLLT